MSTCQAHNGSPLAMIVCGWHAVQGLRPHDQPVCSILTDWARTMLLASVRGHPSLSLGPGTVLRRLRLPLMRRQIPFTGCHDQLECSAHRNGGAECSDQRLKPAHALRASRCRQYAGTTLAATGHAAHTSKANLTPTTYTSDAHLEDPA